MAQIAKTEADKAASSAKYAGDKIAELGKQAADKAAEITLRRCPPGRDLYPRGLSICAPDGRCRGRGRAEHRPTRPGRHD